MAGSWTNNWTGIKRIVATNTTAAGTVVLTSGAQLTGEYYQHTTKPSMPMDDVYGSASTSTGYVTLRIGGEQSVVTPSPSDYNIYGPITSGINYVSVVNGTISYNPSTGIAERVDSVTIQNTGAGAITVYEWGLFGSLPLRSSGITYAEMLLYRGVLDTPVTLATFETITITFTRRMQLDV